MAYIHADLFSQIETLKAEWKLLDALKLVNSILITDPENHDALLHVADIQYRSWEIEKAEKAVDFMIHQKNDDAMSLYVKWILSMEKTQRSEAIEYLKKAVTLTKFENPEVIRAFWLAHYRYWNREKWIDFLEQAWEMAKHDAEIIVNLCQVYTLEQLQKSAVKMIKYFDKNKDKLEYYDKPVDQYIRKMELYRTFWNLH